MRFLAGFPSATLNMLFIGLCKLLHRIYIGNSNRPSGLQTGFCVNLMIHSLYVTLKHQTPTKAGSPKLRCIVEFQAAVNFKGPEKTVAAVASLIHDVIAAQ